MVDAADFQRLALGFKGTTVEPHRDRTAFRVVRTYASLAPDGVTANLKLTPDEQSFTCLLAPDAFSPVCGGWGKQGWTTARLGKLTEEELAAALLLAWQSGRLKTLPKATKLRQA
ncbi:MAG: MmcQ/YjbR family DNA-binding protein [Hyphomicrobiales bacterium]|nr:MmcQ/YjbR family DNA-binding protein [Hyphomicrobiales bacterium]